VPTYNKSHNQRSLTFDALSTQDFDTVASVPNSQAITTVAAILPIPCDIKIVRVSVAYTALTGAPQMQLIVGTGAAGSVGQTDTVAPAGTIVFAAPQVLTAAAGTIQTFYPANFDVIYASSNPSIPVVSPALTVRFITGASDSLTNVKVVLGLKAYDQHFAATMAPTPAGNYAFDSSTF
jgi:hypothetical protein